EPLDPFTVDQTLDAVRRLKGEIHAYIRRTVSRTKGGSEGRTHTEIETSWKDNLPYYLYGLAMFSQLAGVVAPFAAPVLGVVAQLANQGGAPMATTLQAAALGVANVTGRESQHKSHQLSQGENWSEQGGIELLDANAEACQLLLQTHIDRLQSARSGGWWRTA